MSESYPIIAPRDDLSVQFHVTKFLTSNTPKFSHHTILLKPREKPRPKLKAYINLAKKSKKEKEALFAAHNVEIDPKDLKWRMEDKKNKRSYIGEPEISKEQGSQFALLVLKNNEFILRPVDFLQFRPEATYRVMSLEEAESEMKSRREGKRWKDRVTLLDKGMEKDKKEKVAGDDDDLALGNGKDDLMKVKKEIDDESAFVEYGEGTTSAKLAARRRNKEAAIDFREKFDDDEEDEPVSDRDYSEEEDEVDLGFESMPTKPGVDEKKQEKDDSSEEEDEDDESEGEEFDENESLSEDSDDENDKKKETKSKKRGRDETTTGTSNKKVKTENEQGHAPLPTGSILEEVLDIAAERGVLERAIRAEFANNGSRGMTIIELTSRLKNKVANLNATRKKIIVGIMKEIARMQQEPGTKQPILYLKS